MAHQNAIPLDGSNPLPESESYETHHSSVDSLGSQEAKIETCQDEEKKEETEVNGLPIFLPVSAQLVGTNPPVEPESPKTHQSSGNLLGSRKLSSETDQIRTQEAKFETCKGKSEEKKGETERLSSETMSNNQADSGRERLKRHRREVAGRVWIPDIWGQEDFLKDWSDCSVFDDCLVPMGISRARAALVDEGRRANSGRFRVENRC